MTAITTGTTPWSTPPRPQALQGGAPSPVPQDGDPDPTIAMASAAQQLYNPGVGTFSALPAATVAGSGGVHLAEGPVSRGAGTRALGQGFGGFITGTDPWSQAGTVTRTTRGGHYVDLGQGVTRWEGVDGYQQIRGLSKDGSPVVHSRLGNNEWWFVDQDVLNPRIRTSATTAAAGVPASPQPFTPAGREAQPMQIAQHAPAVDGAQYSTIERANGQRIQVYSQSPLAEGSLRNIAQTVHDAHPTTYPAGQEIYVLDQLGEVRTPGSTTVSPAAGTTYGTALTAVKDHVASPQSASFVLNHEAGHVLDGSGGRQALSEAVVDGNGKAVFGEGQLRRGLLSDVNLRKSDFVSEYASANRAEDFAETHRFAMDMRAKHNARRPGAEMFELDSPALQQELAQRRVSPGLRQKVDAVVGQYRTPPASPVVASPTPEPVPARFPVTLPDPPTAPGAAEVPSSHPSGASTMSKMGHALEKGGGALSVVGGTYQALHGVEEIRRGEVLDGTADAGQGALNVAGGAAMIAGGAAATVAAPIVLGAGAVLDGGRDLVHGIRDGNQERVAVGGTKGLGGALMTAGGVAAASGAGAPVGAALAVVGGVVYAGAVVYESREAIGRLAASTASAAADVAQEVGRSVSNVVSDAASAVEGGVRQAVAQISSWW